VNGRNTIEDMTDEHEDREDEHTGPVAKPAPSAPPTEAIILKSSD
jgi:hypothetical protein